MLPAIPRGKIHSRKARKRSQTTSYVSSWITARCSSEWSGGMLHHRRASADTPFHCLSHCPASRSPLLGRPDSPTPSDYSISSASASTVSLDALTEDSFFSASDASSSGTSTPARSSSIDLLHLPNIEIARFKNRKHARRLPSPPRKHSNLALQWPLPPFTRAAILVSLALIALSAFPIPSSRYIPLPATCSAPIYLQHSRQAFAAELANALLSPLLLQPTFSSIALGVSNFALLGLLEHASPLSTTSFSALVGAAWSSVTGLRVLGAHVFSYLAGRRWPALFYNQSAHECSSGLAPLLIFLYILTSFTTDTTSYPISVYSNTETRQYSVSQSTVRLSLLAAGLFLSETAVTWAGLSSLVAASILGLLYHLSLSFTKWQSRAKQLIAAVVACSVLLHSSSHYQSFQHSLSQPIIDDITVNSLHPQHEKLLTILLMTAPRPGNPDFLIHTLNSYLTNFPDVDTNITDPYTPQSIFTSRTQIVVYTHFSNHAVFSHARDHIFSPELNPKAGKYVKWIQRTDSNRLDLRLHLARALKTVTTMFDSAYVMLAEDDFPLCGNQHNHRSILEDSAIHSFTSTSNSWNGILRALTTINSKMPDRRHENGHCGVFVGTGGSGLIMRGWMASKLPSLLLGAHDTDGLHRVARAEAGLLEMENEVPPDVAIQDCLLGRTRECQVCAAPTSVHGKGVKSWSVRKAKSARLPHGVAGDRWGKSGLAATEELLMYHVGYNSSTVPDRKYKREEWACGWRHPFNGDAEVMTIAHKK